MIVKLQQKYKIEPKTKEKGDSKKKEKASLGKAISNSMLLKKSEMRNSSSKKEDSMASIKKGDSKNPIR